MSWGFAIRKKPIPDPKPRIKKATDPESATLDQIKFLLAYLCDRMSEIRMVSRFWYRMFQMNPYFRLGRCKFAARHRPLPTLNILYSAIARYN
jgi:hypothetical protein